MGEAPALGQVQLTSLEGGGQRLTPGHTNTAVLTTHEIVFFSQGTTSVMCELISEQGPGGEQSLWLGLSSSRPGPCALEHMCTCTHACSEPSCLQLAGSQVVGKLLKLSGSQTPHLSMKQ